MSSILGKGMKMIKFVIFFHKNQVLKRPYASYGCLLLRNTDILNCLNLPYQDPYFFFIRTRWSYLKTWQNKDDIQFCVQRWKFGPCVTFQKILDHPATVGTLLDPHSDLTSRAKIFVNTVVCNQPKVVLCQSRELKWIRFSLLAI